VPLPASKQLWAAASDGERRALVEEMVEGIEVSPDDLEVAVFGAPRLNATLAEVGLGGGQSQNACVGGATYNSAPRPVEIDTPWSELHRTA
jgi:hypothetical protein